MCTLHICDRLHVNVAAIRWCFRQGMGSHMRTAIVAGRVFDGITDLGAKTVVIADGVIESIGDDTPAGVDVVPAPGATLLPGLIDAHVHTDTSGLRMALQFGVTTELEMQGA